jgi:hypothetical protein
MEKAFLFELGQRIRDLGVWMVQEYKPKPEDFKQAEPKPVEIKAEPRKPPEPEERNFSRIEAAKYLGIHVNTIDKSGIPRVRIGSRTIFRKVALDRYLREREGRPESGRAT